MDATRLYLAECVGVIVLPISHIIIASAYKELIHSLNGHSLLRITAITTSGSRATVRGELGTGGTCPPLAGTFLALRAA